MSFGTLWIIGRIVIVVAGVITYMTAKKVRVGDLYWSSPQFYNYDEIKKALARNRYIEYHYTLNNDDREKLEKALTKSKPAKRRLVGLAMILFSEVALLVFIFKGLMWLLDKAYKLVQWVGDQTKGFFKQLRSDINEVLKEEK